MMPFVRTSLVQRANAVATAIVVGLLLLVLPGCGIPKLGLAKHGPPLPGDFNGATTSDNTSYVGTSEFFNDPRLTGLINQALWGNQQLRILSQDIAIANNEILKRRGAFLPFVTLGGSASLDKLSTYTPFGADLSQIVSPTGQPFPNPLPDFLLGADITWQVDIWRQLRNARDSAGLRYLGTVDGWNFVVTRLVADISENYYKLMALDKQLETLDRTIALQEQSLEIAKSQKEGARGTELAVQRFQAEVRKNQSDKLIIYQQIIETENRINFLAGRYPQAVERDSNGFIDLNLYTLSVGVPSQLLLNRPDIRQAERDLQAAGLDVRVARANFYPRLTITSGVGYEAFNAKYLFFTPESLIYGVAGGLVAPLINKRAIQADYLTANAKQLQAIYEYQRVTLNAFTEVVNRVSKVQNYSRSIELKKQQLDSLESAVDVASKLFQNARVEYMDVLFAQRDRNDARLVLIDTKREQLSAIVNAYQALGGGWRNVGGPAPPPAVDTADQHPATGQPAGQPAARGPAGRRSPHARATGDPAGARDPTGAGNPTSAADSAGAVVAVR